MVGFPTHVFDCIATTYMKKLHNLSSRSHAQFMCTRVPTTGLKVGWMIWTIWVTCLEGQVGLIHKINYLDVTQISHVY